MAEPDFEKVAEFGHSAHGGSGGAHRIPLLYGDGGTDVLNAVDPGAVHHFEKLTRVGAERLHIATLAFGMKGLEYEGRFPRPTQARDHDEFAQREIEIESLQIVLAYAA